MDCLSCISILSEKFIPPSSVQCFIPLVQNETFTWKGAYSLTVRFQVNYSPVMYLSFV